MARKLFFSRIFGGAGQADEPQAAADEPAAPAAEAAPEEMPDLAEPPPVAPEPGLQAPTEAAPQPVAAPDPAPLFIIGCAPDAAALLTRCLIAQGGFAGHEQGLLLPLMHQLTRTVNQFYRNGLAVAGPDALIRHVDADTFLQPIRRMFTDVMAAQHPHADWIDNTQGLGGIQAAPALRGLWPRARFIFLANRLLESVAQPPATTPAPSLRERVLAWVREMRSWSDTRPKIRGCSLTIERHTLLTDPAAVAAAVADFLNLDAGALEAALCEAVRAAGDPPAPLTLACLPGWEGDEAEALLAASAPTMAAYGYAWGETYFTQTAP
jgi:hypothetical protein